MRHRWAEAFREAYTTERRCIHCGMIRITDHNPDPPEYRFLLNGVMQPYPPTPPCIPAEQRSNLRADHVDN